MVGQLYAEFQIPQKLLHPYPIVMIHGGSQTGTNFTGTPDGREGWAQYFLRRGYAVYVVDQVARGRAGYWTNSYGAVTAPELERELQRFAAPERYKLWPQAHLHTPMAGRGAAGRSDLRSVLRLAISVAEGFRQAAGAQSRRRRGAARQDRACDPAHPLAIRRHGLADRRQAAEPGEGHRRRRAERPAGPRYRLQGRAGLVRRCRQDQDLRPRRRAAHLRSAAQGRRGTRLRAPGQAG